MSFPTKKRLIDLENDLREETVTITSAQLLALFTTPITIIPALGANLAAVPTLLMARHGGGTAYAADAGDDLVLKYTNASGTQCSSAIEATGFLSVTTPQIRIAASPAASGSTTLTVTPVANSPVVAHMLVSNLTTGNFPLILRVQYLVIPIDFA